MPLSELQRPDRSIDHSQSQEPLTISEHGTSLSPCMTVPLPSDPTAALQTVLKWIADSLSSEDVEAIAYINKLPGPADQRTALGVLRELEKKGLFSHNNIDPLVRELANINRYDIIKRAWFEDFRRTCTGMY